MKSVQSGAVSQGSKRYDGVGLSFPFERPSAGIFAIVYEGDVCDERALRDTDSVKKSSHPFKANESESLGSVVEGHALVVNDP